MTIQMAQALIIGDIHSRGDLFQQFYDRSVADNIPLILLGDLVDRGNTPALLFELLADLKTRGLIKAVVTGNHDHKLYRHCLGRDVVLSVEAAQTAIFFDENEFAKKTFMSLIDDSYLMYRWGDIYCVHGAMNPNLIGRESVKYWDFIHGKMPKRGLDIFLYGYTTGKVTPEGYPERDMRWVNRIPAGVDVFKGHDFTDVEVRTVTGELGGTVTFVDTGCGHKGGILSGVLVNGT